MNKITLKNEDGTLNIPRDPQILLASISNYIHDTLGSPQERDLRDVVDELHAVTGYWLLDFESIQHEEIIEKDIKKELH